MPLIKPAPAAAAAAAWPVRKRVTVAAVLLVLGGAMAALAFLWLAAFPAGSLLPPMPGACVAADFHAVHWRATAEQLLVAAGAMLLAAAAAAAVPCPKRVLFNIADWAVVAVMACGGLDVVWVAVACHDVLHGATAIFFYLGVAAAIATPLVAAAAAIRRPLAAAM
ncbi:hypothetical protein ACP70R_042313 [Stipagrostis hirtigluma subsp. patula]